MEWERMGKPLRDLVEIIHFTESVSAKIHGVRDEAEIYRTVKEEFAQSKRYTASILLLTDDGSKLGIAETSLPSGKLKAGEKAAGLRLKGYKIDLNKPSIYSQVIREGKTLQVNVSDVIDELFPRPLAHLISKTMGYEKTPCILTPLKRHGEIIGAFAISSTDLARHFIPSVRNLAQHISTALEVADEYAERKCVEEELRKYRDRLEELVEERTAELIKANEQLQREITERKQAEEALRESEASYRELADSIADVFFAFDKDLRYTYWNRASENLTGIPAKDAIGKPLRDLFPDTPQTRRAERVYRDVLRTQEPQSVVTEYQLGGKDFVFEISAYPSKRGLSVFVKDITERKRAEEALRGSEETARALLNAPLDTALLIDTEGTVLAINEIGAQRLDKSVDELVGSCIYGFMPPDVAEERKAMVDEVIGSGQRIQYEDVRQGRYFDNVVYPVFDSQGKVDRLAVFARKITERKRAEEALELKVEQLAALSQASRVVTASLELDQVLAEIVSLASKVVGSDYTSVVLVDEAGQLGRSAENVPGVPAIEYRIRDEGFTSWIVRWRQAVVIDEIGEDGTVTPDLGQGAPRFANPPIVEAGVRSLAGLPLMVKDHLLGVLYLHSLRVGAFQGQLPLLTAFANQAAIAIENARLYQAERKRASQLAVVNQVARRAASILDMDRLMQEMVTAIQQSFNYYHVGLFLLDELAGELEMRAIAGSFADIAPPDHRLALGEGMTGWTAKTGQPLLANDVSQEPHYVPDFPEESLTKAELCVPLKLAGKVIGGLDIQSSQLNAFDETDLGAMETLAGQLAVAIENAKLYQETVRRLEETQTLGVLTTTLSRSLDPDQVLQAIVDSTTRLIPASTNSVIHLVDETTGKLIPRATLTPGVNVEEKFGMPIGEGIAGLVVQEKRLINVPNLEEDPRFLTTDTAISKKSLLTVPLLIDGDCIGTLSLNSDQVGAFSADDEWLLTTLAAQAAVAVKNARLFEQAQQEIAERKRAEEALRESEERFRMVLESSMDNLYRRNLKTNTYDYMSPAVEHISGYSAEELLSMPLESVVSMMHPDDIDRVNRVMGESMTGDRAAYLLEYRFRHKDGQYRWLSDLFTVVRDAQGRPLYLVGSVRDITERKRAEEALREAELRYRTVADFTYDWEDWENPDGTFRYVSPACERITGYAAKRFMDGPGLLSQLILPQDREIWAGHRRDAAETPGLHEVQFRIRRPDGEIRWVERACQPVTDQQGAFLGYRGSNRDITERKRAEEKHRTIVKTALDGFVLSNMEGKTLEVNDSYCKMLGYSREELLKMSASDFVAAENPEEVAQHLKRIAEQGYDRFESQHRRKDGKIIDVEVSVNYLDVEEGQMFVFLRDITERKRAEEEITKHRKDLQRLSAQLIHAQEVERKRISQELHDEMGQALTAMSINLAAIEKELPSDLAPTTRGRLAETSSLADQTLEQVRELSLDLRPSMLDDLGLVPTLRWYVNRYAKRLDIEVEFEAVDLEERLPAEMETALYRVVQEALTNVARHAQANKVRIHLERKKAKVRTFIEDDGQGFDAQGIAGRKISERGAGLLGIRERIASLGGRFSIRSRPGRGTRLTVEIPLPL